MTDVLTIKQLRNFGFLVGGGFALIGGVPVVLHGAEPRWWALALAGALVLPALVFPTILWPVYRAWMAIGHVLGWVNTRLILGVVFFGLFTPLGVVMRWCGKDLLRLRLEPDVPTYRTLRQGRSADHLRRQF